MGGGIRGILAESRFDALVEGFAAAFYADRLDRPNCRLRLAAPG